MPPPFPLLICPLIRPQHPELAGTTQRWLIGRVAALINDVKPAKVIVDEMVRDAARLLEGGGKMVQVQGQRAKL
jgi:hypothetical protein